MVPIAGLGKAFVEVHADTRPFAKELVAEISAIIAAAEKALGPSAKKLGETIADKVSEGVRSRGARIGKTVKEALDKDKPKVDVDVDVDRAGIKKFLANTRSQFLAFGSSVKDGLSNVFSGLKTFVANIFNIPEKSPLTGVLTVLAIGILPALIPLVIGLAAAFADLLGFVALIPGAIAAIIAILPPLIIGFKGLGEAIGLAFEKDPKKFKEGLEQMSPPVRALTKLFREFVPIFERIGAKIEAAFLGPLTKALRPALRALLPTLEKGFGTLAGSLGRFFASIVTFLGSPQVSKFLGTLFPTLAGIIDRLGPSVIKILEAMTKAAEASLPFLERVADAFGGFLENFAELITKSIEDGTFQKFLDDAFISLGHIKDTVLAILGFFQTLFAETDEDGRTMLDILTELFKQFDEFFKSEKGKKFLKDMTDLAILFLDNLKLIIPVIASMAVPFLVVSRIINEIIFLVRILIELIRQALGLSNSLNNQKQLIRSRGQVIGSQTGSPPFFAEGGITDGPTIAGEAGPELVLPLTKPNRAAALLNDVGLLGPPNVYVFLGTSQITDILDVRVDKGLDRQARALANGPRST